jgi:hypothetical protein
MEPNIQAGSVPSLRTLSNGSLAPAGGSKPPMPRFPEDPEDPFDKDRLFRLFWNLPSAERNKVFVPPCTVAGQLALSESRTRALVSEGKLPALKISGRVYIYVPGIYPSISGGASLIPNKS